VLRYLAREYGALRDAIPSTSPHKPGGAARTRLREHSAHQREELAVTQVTTAKDPKPTSERIQQLAQRVLIGDIVLPEFQRHFVWKRNQILALLDSIFRNYPIGSLLVWESHQPLANKRTIADLEIGARSPNYPVNYLLDGQQRLSTICGVLFWKPGDPTSVWNVAFDLRTQKFFHVDHSEELPIHQIPLRRLADPSDFFRRISPLDDADLTQRADFLFNRFKDYQLPLVTLGDMSITDVAPVFERINSTGTRLTIYDLMRAATWSPDFDLGKTIGAIKDALEPKRFSNLDNKTFLRTLGAAAGGDFSADSIDALRNLSTTKLDDAAQAVRSAAERAADFLATEIGVPRAESLPYANQFAVLCEIFRHIQHPSGGQLLEIRHWFWRTTLSGYFGGWDSGQMADDARHIRQYALNEAPSLLPNPPLPDPRLWGIKPFRSNSAVSKMLGIMLAHHRPVDLVNGQLIDVDKSLAWSNDKEYHHLFPQAYLARGGIAASGSNVVGNIILLTSRSNLDIRDSAPSLYLKEIITRSGRDELLARLRTNLVPEEALEAAMRDDYDAFLKARGAFLHETARTLAGETSEEVVPADEVDDSDDDTTA
jgi:hypothetical protein